MYVVDNARLQPATLPGIEHRTLAGQPLGMRQLSVWQQTIAAGQATPPHRHECEEVVVVTAGRGELHIAGRVERFGPNQTLLLPAGVDHQIVNTGEGALCLTAAFSETPVRTRLPDGSALELPWAS